MKKIRAFFSIFMSLVLLLGLVPSDVLYHSKVSAETVSGSALIVESKYASPGEEINIAVNIQGNPGIAGATLMIEYDSQLKLMNAGNGDAWGSLLFTKPARLGNPCTFLWDSERGSANADGVILNLTFLVSEQASRGEQMSVKVSYVNGDIFTEDYQNVHLQIVNGCITLVDYIPGDVNGDNSVNGKDVTGIRRHIVGGYEQTINTSAADVNEDDRINAKDINLIRRFIVGDDVVLKPSSARCAHSMKYVPGKEASCTEDGNITFYSCDKCGKYFLDSDGQTETSLENTRILATGHNPVSDPAVEPTEDSVGLTEGSHCSICNEILQEQIEIPMLEKQEYPVVYTIAVNDTYLQGCEITNPNSNSYQTSKGLVLIPLNGPEGYAFEGWYDGPGKTASKVSSIPKGSEGARYLYAHWSLKEYKIQFDSPKVPVETMYYTVNTGALNLPVLEWFGYTFIGWTDENGNIVKRIDPGTARDIGLRANWTSNRYQTRTKSSLGKPLIVEDQDNKQFEFVYEIGVINNVPVNVIRNYGNTAGITISDTVQVTNGSSTSEATKIANVVSDATTKSSEWTLSEDWNKVTRVSESYLDQHGITREEAETIAKSETGEYLVSNSVGGAKSYSSSSGGSSYSDTKVTKYDSKQANDTWNSSNSNSNTNSNSVDLSLNASLSTTVSGTATAKTPVSEVSGSTSLSSTISGGVSTSDSNSKTTSHTGSYGGGNTYHRGEDTVSDSGSSSNWQSSATSSSSWNTEKSYKNSNTTSRSNTVSQAISDLISSQYGYGIDTSEGGRKSTANSTGMTETNTNEYASTFEYASSSSYSKTESVSLSADKTGYYRLVSAASVHVFGVVGYDVASESYYTYTYNVMDNATKPYLDYSIDDPDFSDAQNGVIKFEIPIEFYEYVKNKTLTSGDFEVNIETGKITDYHGSDQNVIVPEYISVHNVGVRIVGIERDAFRGNKNLYAIYLPDSIEEIPNDAFSGCEKLHTIYCDGVKKIGRNAFKDCTNMRIFTVPETVTELGLNAFENARCLIVNAANKSVADAAFASGAKRIDVDISKVEESFDNSEIEITSDVDFFRLVGNAKKSYKNVSVKSDAGTTVLETLSIVDSAYIPLKISSADVTLDRVKVENANGFAIVLSGEEVEVKLYGNNTFSSKNNLGALCKTINLTKGDVSTAGYFTVSGKLYTAGHILKNNAVICDPYNADKMLVLTNGEIVHITSQEFDNLLTSFDITLDPNGGVIENNKIKVMYGQQYGALPEPKRSGYRFEGWYTEKAGGTLILETSIVGVSIGATLYAHWTPIDYTLTFDPNGGTCSVVSRKVNVESYFTDLPEPKRDTYKFLGWYTPDGTKITASSRLTTAANLTVTARWELNPLLGWVKESQLPANAVVVNRKWSYDQRTEKTSGSSSMSGYTHYKTERTGWGGTQGPVYSNPDNGVRNVWSESYETGRTHHWVYYRYASSSGTSGSDVQSATYCNFEAIDLTEKLSVPGTNGNNSQGWRWYYDGTHYRTFWFSREYDDIQYGTRWYYQDPVYTYYFYRVDSKESTTYPNGSGISNIQSWVQYRMK